MNGRCVGLAAAVAAITMLLAAGAFAGDGAEPVKLVVGEKTLRCIGLEWYVEGDDNRNARVLVQYRAADAAGWLEALELVRVEETGGFEKIPSGQVMFAGSVLGLEPGREYLVQLMLRDPDGPDLGKTVRTATRSEPSLPEGMRVRYVIPLGDEEGGGTGRKEDPFVGLAAAGAAAEPGDDFRLAAGIYGGTFKVAVSGAETRPIAWRGPTAAAAIIDGGGAERGVDVTGVEHVWLERLSVTNAEYGIVANESSYVTVRRCHVYEADTAFEATANPMRGNYVADNVFEGRIEWDRRTHGTPRAVGTLDGKSVTDFGGVNISGEGIVVCHNRISNFGDAVQGYGRPPKSCIDIYNNEISNCADDGIETDGSTQNVRVFDNRITNCHQGISTQPVYGGPVYIFRNAIYNVVVEPFKLHNSPSGVFLFNNTSVRAAGRAPGPMFVWTGDAIRNCVVLNNIFAGGAKTYALEITAPLEGCCFNYNAYAGGPFANFAKWKGKRYLTLADLRMGAGQEVNGMVVGAAGLFASGILPPEDSAEEFDATVNDLRPAEGAKVVDAGLCLPTITEGFSGAAPDLGAYELGAHLPHYGPRP